MYTVKVFFRDKTSIDILTENQDKALSKAELVLSGSFRHKGEDGKIVLYPVTAIDRVEIDKTVQEG